MLQLGMAALAPRIAILRALNGDNNGNRSAVAIICYTVSEFLRRTATFQHPFVSILQGTVAAAD
jgi:hypothetical protein